MKKYKVSFSFFNLFQKSQQEVVILQQSWAGIAAIICGSTYFNSTPEYTLIAALGCALVDKLLPGLYFEEIK